MKLERLVKPYRITRGDKFRLRDIDPGDTGGLDLDRDAATALLRAGTDRLAELQDRLYAQNRWAVLVIFQAMEAAGKDSAIKHVMSGVNPQGCQVHSFKVPSTEELNHDFMWRALWRLPTRGVIGIFNRSYYEETLVVCVHPEILAKQPLPESLVGKNIWSERFQDINAIERYLARNGVVICKFFLHLSRAEQKKRFLERLNKPEKHWKFSANDVAERQHWADYMTAYEDMIRNTATPEAPWHVVPADNKWFTRLVVAGTIISRLEALELAIPMPGPEKQKELKAARLALQRT